MMLHSLPGIVPLPLPLLLPIIQNYDRNKIPAQICVKNHNGPLKSMESRGIVELFIEIWGEKKGG